MSKTKNGALKSDDFAMENALADFATALGKLILMIITEIGYGLYYGTAPIMAILGNILTLIFVFWMKWDKIFWSEGWYPEMTHSFYYWFVVLFPLWSWGIYRVVKRRQLENKMNSIFASAGIKDSKGFTPLPVFDLEQSNGIRKMRLKRGSFPIEDFEKAKRRFESGLGVYVDDIREDLQGGTVDIIYSKSPIPSVLQYDETEVTGKTKFLVGGTRSNQVVGNLLDTPHLLVAGQTGSGKSTFVRGLITSLYLNDKKMDFTLIDLKGGLEFQLFENLKRVKVIPSIERAVKVLKDLQVEMEKRMKLLKENDVKDLEELFKKLDDCELNRRLVVVDEAAEIFLSGHHATSGELAIARKAISQIARQGRAVGVHLVLATQRPDSKAVDPQVKTNLTGICCFQMPNNISSITVLDNGKATQLPDIPGRAIWKTGGNMRIIQTPHLSIEKAREIFSPMKEKSVGRRSWGRRNLRPYDLEV